MGRRAILLVEAALGKSVEVMRSLRALECVKCADRVTPPYDVIAMIEIEASEDVTEEIPPQVGMVDGIVRTVVCSIQDHDLPVFSSSPRDDSGMLIAGHFR